MVKDSSNTIKLASWNVNGLRAVMKKGELMAFVESYQPDILCLQEIKMKPEQLTFEVDGYELIMNSAVRAGYSGTAILVSQGLLEDKDYSKLVTRDIPSDIEKDFNLSSDNFGNTNTEGRVTVLDLPNFYLATVYTPNSKGDLSRLSLRHDKWDPAFLKYMVDLQKKKPVIFCGDLNVAAQEIDLANPKQNIGKHGFTDEEREGFTKILDSNFVDSFREIHGDKDGQYTWWSHWGQARSRNVGWRIDYFLVDSRLSKKIISADIHPEQMGSDHCPISLEIG